MKISELRIGQGNIDVQGTLTEIGETRTFNRFGRELTVANAVLKDDSGTIKLSLWNDNTDRFKEGDKIRIINGYVNEFQGEKQLTSGKFGSIEKIDSSGLTADEQDDKEEKIVDEDVDRDNNSSPSEESDDESSIEEVEFWK